MTGHDKSARIVPQLRIPGAGSRANKTEPPKISRPINQTREQWPLPPGSSVTAPSPRPLVAPPRPPRPESKDTLAMSGSQEQQSNRLTVPDSSSMLEPSPNESRPITGASYASTSSRYSTADDELPPEVPEFPQQLADDLRYSQQQAALRSRPPLGPPPSARRGPPSYYYSQHVPADVIEEESDSNRGSARPQSGTRTSFASSNVMGHNSVTDYYSSSAAGTPPVKNIATPAAAAAASSAGLRSTAAAMQSSSPPQQRSPPRKPVSTMRPTFAGPQHSDRSMTSANSGVLGKYASHMYPRSSFGSEKTMSVRIGNGVDQHDPMPAPHPMSTLRPPPAAYDISRNDGDPRVHSILGRLTKGGALGYGDGDDDEDQDGYDDDEMESMHSETMVMPAHIPQQQQMQQPQQPQQHRRQMSETNRPGTAGRASVTSLPGLIKRATTLASNLDRGRTASRVMSHWPSVDPEKPRVPMANHGVGAGWPARQSTFSDAFPPSAFPADHTGHTNKPKQSLARRTMMWPFKKVKRGQTISYFRDNRAFTETTTRDDDGEKRYCGLPARKLLFVTIGAALLLLLAVLLPIVLVVLPNDPTTKPTPSLETCQKDLPCLNGGVSWLGNNSTSCQCLCVDGHTGDTCTAAPREECTGVDLDTAKNATVGDAYPRLFTGAPSNWSVTLDKPVILGLFATTNLTCASENALVTFNGLMARDVDAVPVEPVPGTAVTATLLKRQGSSIVFSDNANNGDSGAQADSTSSAAASSSATSTADEFSGSGLDNDQALDVARIAVLFVLQNSNQLNDAIVAQQALQEFFANRGQTDSGQTIQASSVDIGNEYKVDLNSGRITKPDGSIVGKTS